MGGLGEWGREGRVGRRVDKYNDIGLVYLIIIILP